MGATPGGGLQFRYALFLAPFLTPRSLRVSMPTPTLTRAAPWQAGWRSAKVLFGPGLVLQVVALGMVLSYYYLPSAHQGFLSLAQWRTEGGYLFSAVASALCGGVM